MDFKNMLTIKQVAETMGVARSTVSLWVTSGKLPALKVGGTYRIKEEDLSQMIHTV